MVLKKVKKIGTHGEDITQQEFEIKDQLKKEKQDKRTQTEKKPDKGEKQEAREETLTRKQEWMQRLRVTVLVLLIFVFMSLTSVILFRVTGTIYTPDQLSLGVKEVVSTAKELGPGGGEAAEENAQE